MIRLSIHLAINPCDPMMHSTPWNDPVGTKQTTDAYLDRLADALTFLKEGDRLSADGVVAEFKVELPQRVSRPSIPRREQVAILRRDGFTCRYCGAHVVSMAILRAIALIWPAEFPYNRNGRTDATHPIFINNSVSIDHVIPHAHGGSTTDRSNLVTACWPCNAQKGEFTLERLGWELRSPASDEWDGFVSSYPMLWDIARVNAPPAEITYHEGWLAALTAST